MRRSMRMPVGKPGVRRHRQNVAGEKPRHAAGLSGDELEQIDMFVHCDLLRVGDRAGA